MTSPYNWARELVTCCLLCLTFVHDTNADDNPHLFVPVEKFLELTLPTCPVWQCRERCDPVTSSPSPIKHGCQCDSLCLLYGDCCYDFFYDCLRYPDEEVRDLLSQSRVQAYRTSALSSDLSEEAQNDIVKYQRCSPTAWGVGPVYQQRFGTFLTSRCPVDWQDNTTQALCEDDSTNWFNSIPASDAGHSSRHYRNVHCAACHGVHEKDLLMWHAEIKCANTAGLGFLKSRNPNDLSSRLLSGECGLEYSLPSHLSESLETRNCWLTPDVNSSACAAMKESQHSADIAKWYKMGIRTINGTEFANPHSSESCGKYSASQQCIDQTELSFLGVKSVGRLTFYKKNYVYRPLLRTPKQLFAFQEPRCPVGTVYNFFREGCFPLECPTGWYGHESHCVPYEVSPVPADYRRLSEGQRFLMIHMTFTVRTNTVTCENIWVQDLLLMIFRLLGIETYELSGKTCEISSESDAFLKTKGESRATFTGYGTHTDNSTKVEPRQRRGKRRRRDTSGEILSDMLPESSYIVSGNAKHGDESVNSDDFTIRPDLRKKLIEMVAVGNEIPSYIYTVAEVSNFDLAQVEEAMSLIRIEMQRQISSGKDLLKMDSVEFQNFNTTPTCPYTLEVRTGLQLYLQEDTVYGYDIQKKEQIPLETVPLSLSLKANVDGELVSSTNVFLCHLPTTTVSLPDCFMKIYEEDDFVLQNNSLYVHATGKLYKRGKFQISRNIAYVCSPPNITNVTAPVTVNRGFFTMSYTQYIVVMVCCCVSLGCLLATFVTYVCFAQLRDISGIILMCLTASLFVAQLLFAAGIDRTEIYILCNTIAISLHFLWLSVFAWMNVLTYDIAHKLRITSEEAADKDAKAFKEYCIFAWGVPFLLVGICTALDIAKGSGFEMEYAKDSCWIGSIIPSIIGFAVPVSLLLLANFALFFCTIYALHAVSRVAQLSEKQKKSRRLLVVYSTLNLILGLSWGFAYAAALTDYTEMWFAFGGLSALQGIFTVCCFVMKARVVQLYKNRFGGKMKKPDFPPEEFV